MFIRDKYSIFAPVILLQFIAMTSIYQIEDWWRHNGSRDREQASGIPYNEEEDYLSKTDDWWDSLTDEEKKQVFEDFFEDL